MCGIVGFTGNRQAAPILLDGLSKLEYRGYDSAGLAVRDGENLAQVVKAKGRLSNLIEKTDGGKALKGTCGIGHTRWATHGEPSQTNADGNMSKEEFIRQRDAYRVQEDERMAQIQRLRTEKNQVFQPVKKDTDNLQAVMDTVGEAGDVMHLSQNVVETFIDRIEVFNDERVKIRFTFEDALNSYEEK